ncbi:hypothetical protein LXM94_24885 [Rhizobium sp. TRM95111]|uniref:hypothetical protein n=1 Tax=Rhizobium alarense TaxID=2846851 RepID=UPI001F367BDF|nr:hypothetical protein [Rhizobium alarense]MCF3643197.1 hypothetical protein [Rhizobium alarense]
MKILTFAGIGAMLLVGIWAAGDRPDPVISNSVPTQGRSLSISNITAATACLAERGERLSNRSSRFMTETACDTVWPGLSRATTWTENGDGTAVLADASGTAVLTVAQSDGAAYEAVDVPDAIITLIVGE